MYENCGDDDLFAARKQNYMREKGVEKCIKFTKDKDIEAIEIEETLKHGLQRFVTQFPFGFC